MSSRLEACHKECLRLMCLLRDTAEVLQLKRSTNYDTIKELERWVEGQLKGRRLILTNTKGESNE